MKRLFMMIDAVAIAASAIFSMAANATDVEWQGGGSTDGSGYYLISANDNWGGTAPTASDNAVFNSGTVDAVGDLSCTDVKIATNASDTATLEKKGGDWTLSGSLYVSEGLNSHGVFRHSGGTMTLANPLFVGSTSQKTFTAQMDITGGTVYANYSGTSGDTMRSMIVGRCAYATGSSTVNVSGDGRLVVANVFWLGAGGPGTLNISDNGEVDVSGGNLVFFGRFNKNTYIGKGNALLWLNGGRLTARGISYNGGDANTKASAFYFNGGTLRAAANNADFLRTTGNTRVMGGGGTIDTAGYSIEIQQTFEANHQEDKKSGTLTITGGGTYKQTGATKYNGGLTVVDGKTTYIKNNDDYNLDIVVKGGSTFQYAGTRSYRRAGKSLTFEDGARFCLDLPGLVQPIYCSATSISIQGALVVSATSANPPEGTCEMLKIVGSGTFPDSVLANVSYEGDPANVTFSLSADKKSIIYSASGAHDWSWSGAGDGKSFSDGANWTCGFAPEASSDLYFAMPIVQTLVNDIANLSVKSITFTADSAQVTIDGAGSITGIHAITNLAAAHHVFNCEVVCADGITPDITRGENNYMTFAGGITMYNAPKTGGKVKDCWSGKITITTTDAQNYTLDNKNYIRLEPTTGTTFTFDNGCIDRMNLEPGATAVVNRLTYQGCSRSGGNNKAWFSLVFDSGNGVLRAGEIKSTTDAVLFHSYAGSDMVGGTIIADKLTCATTKQTGGSFPYPVFMLNCGAVSNGNVVNDSWNGEGVWVIGPGGLAFGEKIHERSHFETKIGKSLGGRPAATLHSFADWALQSSPNGRNAVALSIGSGNSGFLAIDTSHYAIGDARYDSATSHTVTLEGMVTGGPLRVEGNGKVVFANEYSDFSGGLTVTNTATASVKAGCKPGSGEVTLATGTTLEVAESGTATLVGTLTLGENSNLAFNFTQRDVAPALAGTATTAAGESVNVKVSAADDLRPKGGTYALTSGMDFSGKTVNLVDKPEWAQGASVVNGDIVLVVKPRGLAFFVR